MFSPYVPAGTVIVPEVRLTFWPLLMLVFCKFTVAPEVATSQSATAVVLSDLKNRPTAAVLPLVARVGVHIGGVQG